MTNVQLVQSNPNSTLQQLRNAQEADRNNDIREAQHIVASGGSTWGTAYRGLESQRMSDHFTDGYSDRAFANRLGSG